MPQEAAVCSITLCIYLDRNTNQSSDGPFALFFWTGKPHLPASFYDERYADMYSNATLPRKPSFDEADVSDKPQWVRSLDRMNIQERQQLNRWHRNQLRSVRTTPEGVHGRVMSDSGRRLVTYVRLNEPPRVGVLGG